MRDLQREHMAICLWTNSKASNYHTFVANRIRVIHEISTPSQWRHVGSKENPAEVLSRLISPDRLDQCNLGSYGSRFLHGKETMWPQPFRVETECTLERKQMKLSSITTTVSKLALANINFGSSGRKPDSNEATE